MESLLDRLAQSEGTFLILGGSDSGKTTLAQSLVRRVLAAGRPAAVLDGDIGQSTYGLPTTLNLVMLTPSARERHAAEQAVVASYFVGSVSPVGHLLPMLVGWKKLWEKALELGARTIIADTTGLIDGPLAWELKLQKIDLLRPSHICAVVRSAELEPILEPCRLKELAISRFPVSDRVRSRSPEERREYRRKKYVAYFTQLKRHRLSLRQVGVWGSLPAGEEGLLIGLNDADNLCLGLGLLTAIDVAKETVEFLSPLPSSAGVKLLRFGSVKIDPLGNEQRCQ